MEYPTVMLSCEHKHPIACESVPELFHLLSRLGLKSKLLDEYYHMTLAPRAQWHDGVIVIGCGINVVLDEA